MKLCLGRVGQSEAEPSLPWPSDTDENLYSDYVLPAPYAGPKITLLSPSKINSTHVNAIFRCQVRQFGPG